jgi:di/tricarboxylate transporter
VVELPLAGEDINFGAQQKKWLIVELIIPPQSRLLGERLVSSRLQRDPDIHIIAIKRRELHYAEPKVKDIRLKIGDILLVRLPESSLVRLRGETNFIIVEDVHHEIVHKRLARRAFLIFGAMVVAASTGLADILICALAAAFLMVLTGCLQLRDAYRAMDGRVLLIIIAMIALSAALEKTGASTPPRSCCCPLRFRPPRVWGSTPNRLSLRFALAPAPVLPHRSGIRQTCWCMDPVATASAIT